MSLYQTLKSDRVAAMKDRENPDAKIKKSIITTLIGGLEQNAKRSGDEISDDDVIQACKKLMKSNQETLDVKHSDELVKENEFLSAYLPKQLTEDEIKNLISESGADNIGKAMGFLNQNYKGQFDGGLASRIARELLA